MSSGKKASLLLMPSFLIALYAVFVFPGLLSIKIILSVFFVTFLGHIFAVILAVDHVKNSNDYIQKILDTILWIETLSIAWNISEPVRFVFFVMLMFITANLKYRMMLRTVEKKYVEFVRQKRFIDNLGIFLCVVTLVGLYLGLVIPSILIGTIILITTSVYLLFIKRFYAIAGLEGSSDSLRCLK